MRYRPVSGVECRQLSRPLEDVDAEIRCDAFKAKEHDLDKIIRSTERYYREIGREYDELWYSTPARRQYNKVYSLLRQKMTQLSWPSAVVLDAGCGTCEWAIVMTKRGASVVGLDQSSKMLQIGKEKSVSQGCGEKLNLICGDLNHLPFKKRAFDGLTATFVLSHLPDDKMRAFLSELMRVIKKAGWMLFVDSRLKGPHQREESLVRTLESGREYLIYKRFFTAPELGAFLERHLSRSFSASEFDRYVVCISDSR